VYNETTKGVEMTWKESLKRQWDDNPIAVIGVGALAATAAAKVLDTMSAAKGRRAYAKQVDYRVKNKK
jgi:hypothetical protein